MNLRIPLVVLSASLLSACNLTVENSGGGLVASESGTINCGDACKASYDGTVTEILTATPDEGHSFTGWSGACFGTDQCTVTITNSGNKTVKATFTETPVDPETLINLPYTDELSDQALLVTQALWEIEPNVSISGIVKSGKEIQILGKGFSTDNSINKIVFQTNDSWNVAIPISSDANLLTVNVPEKVKGLFVANETHRSNLIEIITALAEAPVLAPESFLEVQPNDTLTMHGHGFSPPASVLFGSDSVTANVVNSTTIEAVVPSNIDSAIVSVSNDGGISNSIAIHVSKSSTAQINLPSGTQPDFSDMVLIGGGLDPAIPNASGSATISTSKTQLDIINANWVDNDGNHHLYLMGWTLPSSQSVDISVDTTAEAMVALFLPGTQDVSDSQAQDLMNIIQNNTSVDELAGILGAALSNDKDFRATGSVEFYQALVDSINSVKTELANSPSIFAQSAPLQGPDITPPKLYGISVVAARNNAGGISGFTNIEQSTPLFLSARYINIEDGTREHKHIESYFDESIIKPSKFLSTGSVHDKIRVCSFIDCDVDIVTPGFNPKSTEQSAAKILSTRTVIEGIVFPIISEILNDKALSPTAFSKILVSVAGPAVDTLGNQLTNGGDADAAIKDFANAILSDILPNPNFGPITEAIIDRYGEKIKAKIKARIGAKLIPIVGEISLALDALGFASGVIDTADATISLTSAPGDLAYEIVWPLQITGLIPESLRNDDGPSTLILSGQGLNKIERVVLLDEGQAGAHSHEITNYTLSSDNRGASILIPGDFLEKAKGPVRVIAHSDDTQSESSEPLQIEGCGPLILDRYKIIDTDNDPNTSSDCSVVQDTVTKLEWQRCSAGQTWNNVSQTCEGTAWQRYRPDHPYIRDTGIPSFLDQVPNGWRLPAVSELRSLVYCSSGAPISIGMTLDETPCVSSQLPTISLEAFPNTINWRYATSTPASANNFWWIVHFDTGKVNGGGYSLPYFMRYVR